MINNFSTMLAFIKQQALSTTGVVDFVHVGSGEILIDRISKYYSNQYKVGLCIFLDTSEGFLDDDNTSNVRLAFLLGITVLVKPDEKSAEKQDLAWNNTLEGLVAFIGKLRHHEQENDSFEMELVQNKLNQVSKVANTDAMGWRNEMLFTINVNNTYCD